ncbi:MAG TPA: tRNA (adenosine(37)-N6)-dimethylallyltransferase MiaA [Verrucomicrobiae bacterium]|nr:tRNA (adenosine(37)-N6)-dimethylallyltransferase MiaA [Verrucomicrobiae bacterium]
MKPPPVFLAGPTAVGKSAVALELAEQLNGEIISVDSMQVYRGLDLGTAKPSLEQQRRVPHHLIDLVDLAESFDAARFVQLARKAVAQIQARQHVPIFCGGTGLYFKAFLEGLGDAPPLDTRLRAELESAPLPELLHELRLKDSQTFTTIDRKNRRRVVRALEVIRRTGVAFSAQRAAWNAGRRTPNAEWFFCLTRSMEDLCVRIDGRVEEMFARGLVTETERLRSQGLERNRTAMQAIGYRQVVEHLRGERALTDTIALVKQKTRQFAKRQMTWFRGQFQPEWLMLTPSDKPGAVAEQIAERTQIRI